LHKEGEGCVVPKKTERTLHPVNRKKKNTGCKNTKTPQNPSLRLQVSDGTLQIKEKKGEGIKPFFRKKKTEKKKREKSTFPCTVNEKGLG